MSKKNNDYDKVYDRKSDSSTHRVAGKSGQSRSSGTHVVKRDGKIVYARVDGKELSQKDLDKANNA